MTKQEAWSIIRGCLIGDPLSRDIVAGSKAISAAIRKLRFAEIQEVETSPFTLQPGKVWLMVAADPKKIASIYRARYASLSSLHPELEPVFRPYLAIAEHVAESPSAILALCQLHLDQTAEKLWIDLSIPKVICVEGKLPEDGTQQHLAHLQNGPRGRGPF